MKQRKHSVPSLYKGVILDFLIEFPEHEYLLHSFYEWVDGYVEHRGWETLLCVHFPALCGELDKALGRGSYFQQDTIPIPNGWYLEDEDQLTGNGDDLKGINPLLSILGFKASEFGMSANLKLRMNPDARLVFLVRTLLLSFKKIEKEFTKGEQTSFFDSGLI